MLRPLRIAVSVVSGICCVLVIALWVRSYSICDVLFLRLSTARCFVIHSIEGGLWVAVLPVTTMPGLSDWWLGYAPLTARSHTSPELGRIPMWIVVATVAAFTSLPWIRWRFSLRTLLLATTLLAILFGLIIYATRG